MSDQEFKAQIYRLTQRMKWEADRADKAEARVAELETAVLKAGKTVDIADRQRAKANVRVSEMTVALEVARDQREVDRQHILDAQVLIDLKTAGMAELEKQLAAGRLLVHASVAAERVSPRLVAWAGEPEQSGEGGTDG